MPGRLRPPAPGRAPAADAEEARLDLNRATQAELERLPGIGPAKARAVIAYRQARPAGFGAVGELLEVKGIGPKIYAEISELVTVNQH